LISSARRPCAFRCLLRQPYWLMPVARFPHGDTGMWAASDLRSTPIRLTWFRTCTSGRIHDAAESSSSVFARTCPPAEDAARHSTAQKRERQKAPTISPALTPARLGRNTASSCNRGRAARRQSASGIDRAPTVVQPQWAFRDLLPRRSRLLCCADAAPSLLGKNNDVVFSSSMTKPDRPM